MNRLMTALLVATTLAGVAIVLATSTSLPDPVASHFGAGGKANGWMTRDGYRLFMLGMLVAVPWLVYGACALSASGASLCRMRNGDYWLAPPRRAQTMATMRRFGAIAGVLISALLVGVHLAVLDAHRRQPPRLDEGALITGLVAFVVAIVALAIAHGLRFRRPREAGSRR
jgi:uncharacterized membrane protein